MRETMKYQLDIAMVLFVEHGKQMKLSMHKRMWSLVEI